MGLSGDWNTNSVPSWTLCTFCGALFGIRIRSCRKSYPLIYVATSPHPSTPTPPSYGSRRYMAVSCLAKVVKPATSSVTSGQ
ncbi:hypothetical protein J6590_048604, partial [Homalodisca vitripennis]